MRVELMGRKFSTYCVLVTKLLLAEIFTVRYKDSKLFCSCHVAIYEYKKFYHTSEFSKLYFLLKLSGDKTYRQKSKQKRHISKTAINDRFFI